MILTVDPERDLFWHSRLHLVHPINDAVGERSI
jgi:hypothetical protein